MQPQQMMQMLQGGAGPSAEQTGEGVGDLFKQIMANAVAVAEAAPDLADLCKQIRQLAMQGAMQVQQMAQPQ